MNKNLLTPIILLACFLFVSANSVYLRDMQSGNYSGGRYIADKTVTIPANDTVVFTAGTTLEFTQYTGLIVNGTLKCLGSDSEKVIFTVKKNSTDDSFIQWNGIVINNEGAVDIANVVISNAAFALKSSIDSKLRLKNITFKNNSEDFSVGDSLMLVTTDTYSGIFNIDTTTTEINNVPKISIDSTTQRAKWKLPIRLSLGAVALSGTVFSVVNHIKFNNAKSSYNSPTGTKSDRETANSALVKRNIFGAVGVGALAIFTVTFLF